MFVVDSTSRGRSTSGEGKLRETLSASGAFVVLSLGGLGIVMRVVRERTAIDSLAGRCNARASPPPARIWRDPRHSLPAFRAAGSVLRDRRPGFRIVRRLSFRALQSRCAEYLLVDRGQF